MATLSPEPFHGGRGPVGGVPAGRPGCLLPHHTCGGILPILDRIPANGCDASETLSPPGVGGDVSPADRSRVKERLGRQVALIGGIDQGNTLTTGTPAQVTAEVRACFETFGRDGGYICSASGFNSARRQASGL